MPSIEATAAAERIAAIEDRDYAGYVDDVAAIIDEDFGKLAMESTMLRCQLSHSRDAASAFESSGEIGIRNRDQLLREIAGLCEWMDEPYWRKLRSRIVAMIGEGDGA